MRQRFGRDFVNQLISSHHLYVRVGREAQFVGKNTERTNTHIKGIVTELSRLIANLLKFTTVQEDISSKIIRAAALNDESWHKPQEKKSGSTRYGRRKR